MNDMLALPPFAWLANYLLHSTVLLVGAWLLDNAGFLGNNRSREFVWRLVLLGAIATATLHTFLPAVSLSGEPRVPSIVALEHSADTAPDKPARVSTGSSDVQKVSAITVSPKGAQSSTGFDIAVADLVVTLWATGAMFLLLRMLGAMRRAYVELSDRERVTHGELHSRMLRLWASIQKNDAHSHEPRLAIVSDLSGPVTLPNGEICLPRWAIEQFDAAQLDAMLAHELAHVRRRDFAWLLVVTVLEALLFVQPLNRVAHRRLTNLAELNADALAARVTGDARELAKVLAHCAHKLREQPASNHSMRFGVAMATRRSPIVQRVERLLGGKNMQDMKPSHLVHTFGVFTLLAAILLLPAFGAGSREARAGALNSTSIIEKDNGEMSYEVGRPGYFLRVKTSGKVEFTADDKDVAFVEEGASLRIREKTGNTLHELVVTTVDGDLKREYSRNRNSMDFDVEAKTWLARVIPEVLRNTAIDAERRVARLHAEGGMRAVLDEMKRIENGHAIGRYAAVVTANHDLDASAMRELLALLGEIGSDFELRQALANIISNQKLDGQNQVQLLQAARSIGSDFEAAELVNLITPHLELTDETLKAWRTLVSDIGSDFEQRRALSAVFEHSVLPAPWKLASLDVARAGIGSDFELRSLLATAAGISTATHS